MKKGSKLLRGIFFAAIVLTAVFILFREVQFVRAALADHDREQTLSLVILGSLPYLIFSLPAFFSEWEVYRGMRFFLFEPKRLADGVFYGLRLLMGGIIFAVSIDFWFVSYYKAEFPIMVSAIVLDLFLQITYHAVRWREKRRNE